LLWIALNAVGQNNIVAAAPLAISVAAALLFVFWQGVLLRPWAIIAILCYAAVLLNVSFQSRQLGDVGLTPQSGLKVIAWCGMLAISSLHLDRLRLYLSDPVVTAFACYSGVCLISAAYSPEPLLSFMAAISVVAYLSFSCVLAESISERTLLQTLLWALAAFSAVNLLSALVIPEIAYFHTDELGDPDSLRFMGIAGHPNTLGRVAAFFAMVVFANAVRGYVKPTVWLPLSVIALVIVIATFSRSTIIALLLAMTLQLPRRYLWHVLLIAAAIGLTISITGQLDNILALLGREGDLNELKSMSGRTDIWAFVSDLIANRPLIGYGFSSYEAYASRFWTGPLMSIAETHNNYLQVLYSTGIFGAVPFVIGFAILVYRWLMQPDPLRDVIVLNTIIYGFSESDAFSTINVLPTLMFCLAIAFDAHRRRL
jgi:O-antigen ligase